MRFPHIIQNTNEEYITIPALKTFTKNYGITVSREAEMSRNKEAYLKAISDYADQSPEHKATVLVWVDSVIKEGIKEVRIMNIPLTDESKRLFASVESTQKQINKHMSAGTGHFVGNTYSSDSYDLVLANVGSDDRGKMVSLLFCRMLRYQDTRKNEGRIIEYPVFVDYYYERGWMIMRYKSRSCLFENIPESAGIEELLKHPLSVTKEINSVYHQALRVLGLVETDMRVASANMQAKFFEMLDRYTHTPAEIMEVLEANQTRIQEASDALMQLCNLPPMYRDKVKLDLTNLVEKFLSISWPDKSVFIKDREAYPTRLSTTDEEDSRIDQSAATADDPLQSKEVFFDNKRMLYNQRRCEGLTLMWQREDRTYYSDAFFPVRFAEKDGICTLSFKKYVVEEDIKRVLFAIIGT